MAMATQYDTQQSKAHWYWWFISILACLSSAWFINRSTDDTSLKMATFMMLLSIGMCFLTYLGTPKTIKIKEPTTPKVVKNISALSSTPRPLNIKTSTEIRLDCQACKSSQSMRKAQIPRFTGLLRFIGFLIALPSALGVIFAVMTFVGTIGGGGGVAVMGVGISMFIGLSSLVGGLIGWFLLMKKKVFKCVNCGYVMERD